MSTTTRKPLTGHLAMHAWKEAAEKWRLLRSEPAMAAVLAARAQWYQVVYGAVPPTIPGVTTAAEPAREAATEPQSEEPPQVDIGARVRIREHALPAYPATYRGWEGIVTGETKSRTGVRRCLVDYSLTGHWGRQHVREEHLDVVASAREYEREEVSV